MLLLPGERAVKKDGMCVYCVPRVRRKVKEAQATEVNRVSALEQET